MALGLGSEEGLYEDVKNDIMYSPSYSNSNFKVSVLNLVSKISGKRPRDDGTMIYSGIFEDGHEEQLSHTYILSIDNGYKAFDLFKTERLPKESKKAMVQTRGMRAKTRDFEGMQRWSDVDISDSDGEVPPRRRRKTTRKSASPSDDYAPNLSATGSEGSEETDNVDFIDHDMDDEACYSNQTQRMNHSRRLKRKSRLFDLSDDELNLRVSDNSWRPRKTHRIQLPNVVKLGIDGRIGARHSARPRKLVNMKEVGEEEVFRSSSDEQNSVTKVSGVRESFKPLPKTNAFRQRHMEICDTCGNMNHHSSPLVYCQGCSLAYHKDCLGARSGSEHLVTKVAENDFVLQCRRCVNAKRAKDHTVPDQSKCQYCKESGPSCFPFRVRKTTAQEQRERQENNGIDPVIYVDPTLVNNPKNVLFRCTKCWRAFHYCHLSPQNTSLVHNDSDADARFHDDSSDWKCKDCSLVGEKKLQLIVAWRPVDVKSIDQGVSSGNIEIEEEKKEYLIKWENISYHHVNWMPGVWVWGVASSSTRKAFALKNPPIRLTTESAVPEEYLSIDIVFDIKYSNEATTQMEEIDHAHICQVESALIKYKGLPYEEAVWDTVPKPEDVNRWTNFVNAYNDWVLGHYTHLPNPSSLKARIEETRSQRFTNLEKKKQTDNITGGKVMKYQLDGLNWIFHNWHSQQNCILADEMGLGKTIQVIAWMAMMIQDLICYPFLLVVPNSTCLNWYREIKQWVPSIRVVAYYGSWEARQLIQDYQLLSNRQRERDLQCHIVITSYETAGDPQSSKFFKSVPWQGLIVDEGQRLKNDKGRLYNVLSSWKIPFRLLLSGTPLQNNTRELFNLLQFLDDKIDAEHMEREYNDMTNNCVTNLHSRIRPYILRRTKKQVLTFLPQMAQIVLPVSMSHLQKKLYKSILAQKPNLLKALFSSKGGGKSQRASMNNVLMQLRKCLCHPFVYSQRIEEKNLPLPLLHRNLVEASSKLQLLELLLPKLKQRGHRVLIFSQFLDMLDIIEDFLTGLQMEYRRLDGSISSLEKQKRINSFNEPHSSLFAFLLSTRAGGVGINLATADTVIILDPDFNPHQDLQALSRAHRIGQTKKVLCFQFMTKCSAEEKIVQIGRKKMALDHVIVAQLDEENLAEKDIESILRHGAAELFFDRKDIEKDIQYDDTSVEKLLDRDQIEDIKTGSDQAEHSQFSFARVWANDGPIEHNLESEDEVAPEKGFWATVIKKREREAAKEAAAHVESLGRGKRSRTNVDYKLENRISELFEGVDNEDDDDDNYNDDEAHHLIAMDHPRRWNNADSAINTQHESKNAGSDKQTGSVNGTKISEVLPTITKGAAGVLLPLDNDSNVPGSKKQASIESYDTMSKNSQQYLIVNGEKVPAHFDKERRILVPKYPSCPICKAIHPLGSCPIKTNGIELCQLCKTTDSGQCETCQQSRMVRIMREELKQLPESNEMTNMALSYFRGVKRHLKSVSTLSSHSWQKGASHVSTTTKDQQSS